MLLELFFFSLSYIGIIFVSLMMIRGFLRFSGYCVDRVCFNLLATVFISREHAKRHREVPKDVFVEFVCYIIPLIPILLVRGIFLTSFTNIILEILIHVTFITYSLSSGTMFIIFVARILVNPANYVERMFVHNKNEREKANYFHDSVTMEEKLEIYGEKKLGFFVISYLTYFYNLSTTMIDGWIRIKRKLVSFFRTYGSFFLLIPLLLVISITIDIGSPEPTEPLEGSYLERNGIVVSSIFLLLFMWVGIYLPFVGWMYPELIFDFEFQVNQHNGGCDCYQRIDHYKKTLELIVESYRSYENALKGG